IALASLGWSEIAFRNPARWSALSPYVGLIGLLIVLVVPWFCVGAAMRSWQTAIPPGPIPGIAALTVLLVGVAASTPLRIIPGLGALTIWVGRLPLSWHLPRWAGDPSYGMYVFAFPIQQCLIHFRLCGESTPVLAVEATALSFAAGVISWHLLEQP